MCPLQYLGSHVDRAAYTGFQHLCTEIIYVLGETKIRNFIDSVVYKNICWFQIPMYNFLLHQFGEATQNLANYVKCLVLLEPSSFDDLF